MKKILLHLAVAVLALPAVAEPIPLLINCQGRLHDGDELLNGKVPIVLRVYTNATAGTYLYEDTSEVEVVDGIYSTFLGDDTTRGNLLEALGAGEAYLEVTANGTTFAPRERMLTVPYAVIAKAVVTEGITEDMVSQGAVVERHLGQGSITADKLADGSVTADKLADGSITPEKFVDVPWTTGGNTAGTGKILMLGTLDDTPLDLTVAGRRALRLLPHVITPSLLGGHPGNQVEKDAGGAVVAGGGSDDLPNRAAGDFVFLGSGEGNEADGAHAAVVGGWENRAVGNRSFVGGGRNNRAMLSGGTVGGGYSNVVNESMATIAGGFNNRVEGYVGTIGGGWNNLSTGSVATVSGGMENRALASAASIGGGYQNVASGYGARVGGGQNNVAVGDYAFIGSGSNNLAQGVASVVPGGLDNRAIGAASLAVGRGAVAAHDGAMVFADNRAGEFASTAPGQVLFRAAGGVGIGTASPAEALDVAGNIKADSVIAKSFIGDGSGLTGLRAGVLEPGSIRPEHLAREFRLPVDRLVGGLAAGLKPGELDGKLIADGSITADQLSPGVLDRQLTTGSVTRAMLAQDVLETLRGPGSVTRAMLDPGVIKTLRAPGSITQTMLAPGILETLRAPGSVTTAMHAPDSITADKLAPNLRNNLLAPGRVTGAMHAPGSITADKLAPGVLDGLVSTGSVTAAMLAPGSITADKLAEGVLPEVPEIPALPDNLLTATSRFKGDVAGTAESLQLAPGVIGLENLNAALVQRLEAAQAALADGSITLDKLSPDLALKLQAAAASLAPGAVTLDSLDPKLRALLHGQQELPPGHELLKVLPGRVSPNLLFGSAANGLDENLQGSVIGGGGNEMSPNLAEGDYNTVSGGVGNRTAQLYSSIGGGADNHAGGRSSTVSGGRDNAATGQAATAGGGHSNRAGGTGTTIAGGYQNQATGEYATVPGGMGNVAAGHFSLAAGRQARAEHGGAFVWADGAEEAFASTGENQFVIRASGGVGIGTAQPKGALTVAGHTVPDAAGRFDLGSGKLPWRSLHAGGIEFGKSFALQSGGAPRLAVDAEGTAVVGGSVLPGQPGRQSLGSADFPWRDLHAGEIRYGDAFVLRDEKGAASLRLDAAGGLALPGIRVQPRDESPNLLLGHDANTIGDDVRGGMVMGGGTTAKPNRVDSNFGTVGGGLGNRVEGYNTTVAGGEDNRAGGIASTIGGGFTNSVSGEFTVVAGGAMNRASGKFAAVGGGVENQASGTCAAIVGGTRNEARGDYSLALGRQAKALHDGALVFADSAGGDLASSAENQFIARASGGMFLFSSGGGDAGVALMPGSGSWASLSDRASKSDLREVDGETVLERLEDLPLYNYHYRTQDETVRHIGPTAQDFGAAFGVGDDQRHINTVDADGVALAAIQGLSSKLRAKEARIQDLEARVESLTRLVERALP